MSSAPIAAAHARVIALARRVLAIEAEAVQTLASQLDDTFTRAVDLILASRGRVIVSGIGKTGHIGASLPPPWPAPAPRPTSCMPPKPPTATWA